MMKKVVLLTIVVALSTGLPTIRKTKPPEKIVAIIPSNTEDLNPAETFYSGYSSVYPSVGISSGSYGGGYGWKGDHKPIAGPVYGAGYELGYPSVGSYGTYLPGAVVVGTGPVITTGGGGYGWRQGVNRWAV